MSELPPLRTSLARSFARVVLGTCVGLTTLVSAALAYCVWMPGGSYEGALPAGSPAQRSIAEQLRRHVTVLAVDIGERRVPNHDDGFERAQRYVTQQLEAIAIPAGLTVRTEPLQHTEGHPANVFVNLPGTRPGPWLIVGAHFDSAQGTRGANDNASGTAAALVLARLLVPTKHTLPIRIVLFANEEPPFFWTSEMGSLQHADGCRGRGEEVRAMLALETMGYYTERAGSQHYPPPLDALYPERGNFIAFVGNLGSRALVREAVRSFRTHARFPSEGASLPQNLPGVGWSDHSSFWQFGYPAVMVTDTALFRDPNYHRDSDVLANLDFDRLACVVEGLQAVILDLSR